tara:strand:- start:486 stop:857 length:372 start_codon:yes stop_codon:yes gene_type:complete
MSLLFNSGCKTESVVSLSDESNEYIPTLFTFKDVKIEGDTLIAHVQYSGGCGDHKFEIKQNGFLMKSLPPKQPLQIIHLSTGDKCRALINEHLKYDISGFRGTPHGTTVLLLKNWTTDIIYSY